MLPETNLFFFGLCLGSRITKGIKTLPCSLAWLPLKVGTTTCWTLERKLQCFRQDLTPFPSCTVCIYRCVFKTVLTPLIPPLYIP